MKTTALVEQLKEAGEDFEFYPTTREMVKMIWDHRRGKWDDGSPHIADFGTVLDIGCGTCNFRRWVHEFNAEVAKEPDGDRHTVDMHGYYVMEKSLILLNQLDPDVVVLGTDFHEATLIDKPVDTIFCNPPYREYEDWAARIITESACKEIYLIIPRRWKESEKIMLALKRMKLSFEPHQVQRCEFLTVTKETVTDVEVIGSADFLDAERAARAKVDIIHINKKYTPQDAGFDRFFDDTFGMPDEAKSKYDFEYQERQAEAEALKAELLTGRNKVEILCRGYDEKQKQLFEHFKTICGLDAGVLEAIGVRKDAVKKALKKNFEGLKNLYWNAAFDCLEEITSRLTSQSRKDMLGRFTLLKTVDFTPSNIYALIVWVIKNANRYTEDQMIDFFMALSSKENVRNYVSNKRVFEQDRWRYTSRENRNTHYTLDYRIVVTKHALPGEAGYEWHDSTVRDIFQTKIGDICTVANNLGFPVGRIDIPRSYGARGTAQTTIDGKPETLFAFRCYQNRNVHIKFNMEFMKALNVAVARKLGWIKNKSDIAREFTPEMAEGAERYFDAFKGLSLEAGALLMLPEPEPEAPAASPDPEAKKEPAPTARVAAKPERKFIEGSLF
ncbi:MAG: DUF4942 domain-containing protein [Lentisphaeria bacterium]|nr:DUF4942 domain-containing protein [Lentisphaeria bacterium]